MGKGRVITAHGEGRYTIELVEDRARAERAKARAEDQVVDLDAWITESQADYDAKQAEVDKAATTLDDAISAYSLAMKGDDEDATADAKKEMVEANTAFLEAVSLRDHVAGALRQLKTERLSVQTRIDRINALPAARQVEAWCADLTTDLTGEVATAEVPGEVGQVLIRPGYEGGAAWDGARDGAMQPVLSGTPASVFYNLAMLPGWQKWRPTFRVATVSNIDNDLCDITLDAATSSQQGLGVNAQASYTGVPIAYMNCNSVAFEEGDRALVAFSGNTDKPMVVGFASQPKACPIEYAASHIIEADLYREALPAASFSGYRTESTPAGVTESVEPNMTPASESPGTGRYPGSFEDSSGWHSVGTDTRNNIDGSSNISAAPSLGADHGDLLFSHTLKRTLTGDRIPEFTIRQEHNVTLGGTGEAVQNLIGGAKATITSHRTVSTPWDYTITEHESGWTVVVDTDAEHTNEHAATFTTPSGATFSTQTDLAATVNGDSALAMTDILDCDVRVNFDLRGVIYVTVLGRNPRVVAYPADCALLVIMTPDGGATQASYSDRWPVTLSADDQENVDTGHPIEVEKVDGVWTMVY